MLLSGQFKRGLAAFAIIEAVLMSVYGAFSGNPAAYTASALFLTAAFCRIRSGSHSALTVILIFYGVLARSAFSYGNSLYGNMYILLPAMYLLFESPMLAVRFAEMNRKTAAGIAAYTLLALIFTVAGNPASLMSRMVSFAVMILPIYYYMDSDDLTRDVINPMFILFPAAALYSILQYFNIFIPTDASYISHFSSTLLTTLKLGSSVRPFSVFSSPEEFSYYLMLITLFSYFMKNRAAKSAGAVSILLLLLFSYRSALFLLAALTVYHLWRMRRKKEVFFLASVLLALFLILRFIPLDTEVKKSDGRMLTLLKHTAEPAKNLSSSYSAEKRIQVLKEDAEAFIRNPFGYGLSHNYRVTGEKGNVFGSESSAVQLILSGGIPFLIFLVLFYIFALRRIGKGKYGAENLSGAAFLVMLPVSHILSFHFVLPLMYAALLRSLDGRD